MAISTYVINESTDLMRVTGDDSNALDIALKNAYIQKVFNSLNKILGQIGFTKVKSNEKNYTGYDSYNTLYFYEYYSYGNSMKYICVSFAIYSSSITISFSITSSLDSTSNSGRCSLYLEANGTIEYERDSNNNIISTIGKLFTTKTDSLKVIKNGKGISLLRKATISSSDYAIITASGMLGTADIYVNDVGSGSNYSHITLYDSEKTYYLGNRILFGCGGTLDGDYIVTAPVYLAEGYETNSKLYHDKKIEGLLQTNNIMQDGAIYNIDGTDHYAIGTYLLMEC